MLFWDLTIERFIFNKEISVTDFIEKNNTKHFGIFTSSYYENLTCLDVIDSRCDN